MQRRREHASAVERAGSGRRGASGSPASGAADGAAAAAARGHTSAERAAAAWEATRLDRKLQMFA